MAQICFGLITVIAMIISGSVGSDPALYSGSGDMYQTLKILRKPGKCQSHKDFPNTIQCAETGLCISFKQFNDTKCDCCGPDKNCTTCTDQSDENRVAPPGSSVCKDHPHYEYGLCYQCANNHSKCLSRLTEWNNGRCDCCPEGRCDDPRCTDHSDEECLASEWGIKFWCDGNCVAISKLNDTETDCWSDCTIETNPTARKGCEDKKANSGTIDAEEFCNKMLEKNTPHFQCTSGNKECIPSSSCRDGKKDCSGGEDEDATLHPDCSSSLKSSKCDAAALECIVVANKPDNTDCRCKSTLAGSDTLDNCNKDRPNRRRRLY